MRGGYRYKGSYTRKRRLGGKKYKKSKRVKYN